jgi:hypothetical protein
MNKIIVFIKSFFIRQPNNRRYDYELEQEEKDNSFMAVPNTIISLPIYVVEHLSKIFGHKQK